MDLGHRHKEGLFLEVQLKKCHKPSPIRGLKTAMPLSEDAMSSQALNPRNLPRDGVNNVKLQFIDHVDAPQRCAYWLAWAPVIRLEAAAPR
jgi:hypothetical protein